MNKNLVQYLQEISKLIEDKKYHRAKKLIKEAQEIEPENDSLYVKKGLIFARLGNQKLAIKNYHKAISLNIKQPAWVFKTLSVLNDQEYLISKKDMGNNSYHSGHVIEAVENYVKYIINLSFTKRKPESQILNNLILGIIYIIKNEQENILSFNLGDFVKNYLANKEYALSFYSVDEDIFFWLGDTPFFYKLHQNNTFNEDILNKIKNNQVKIFYSLNINYPPDQIYDTDKFIQRIPKMIIQLLNLEQVFLVLDSSNERHRFNSQYYHSFYKLATKLRINTNRIIYLTQNVNFIKNFASFHKEEKQEEKENLKPNLIHFNRALIDFIYIEKNRENSSVLSASNPQNKRDKKFLCLNNVPRAQRVYLFYWLRKHDLLKDGFVSFNHRLNDPTLTGYPVFKDPNYLNQFFPTYTFEQLSSLYQEINSYLPIYLDLQDRSKLTNNGRGDYVRELPTDLFERTYFSIITESDFNNGTLGFTEKILKPLLSFHPFIVIGEPGILQLLKDLGFKTFKGFIDESYDQENDGLTRINMALNEVNKLCQYSYQELDSWYQEITPILQHNYDHFTQNIIPNSLQNFKNQVLKLGDY